MHKAFTLLESAMPGILTGGKTNKAVKWPTRGAALQEAWGLILVENWGFPLLSSVSRYGIIE